MAALLAELSERFFRPAVGSLVPYEPGKPVEEVQRELGLTRVVKLASNEGPYGPFPAALEAIARGVRELNRYPDGGAYRLRAALAERHDVRFEEVAVGSGADGIVDDLTRATVDPRDEIVCGWPSFPSYVIDAAKQGGTVRSVPLVDARYDLGGLLSAVGPRTKLVYICHPNNPTGTMNTTSELDAYFQQAPDHVLTVVDQAYFEYIDDPDYPDAIERYAKRGHRVLVLRTFSKIYGLAGLRIGYCVGPAPVVTALAKVRPAFDVSSLAQEAALASMDETSELERRRAQNTSARAELEGILRGAGLEPAGPAVANFVYLETGRDARPVFEALLAEGAIVRPLAGFGAPEAIRVTVGTPEEQAFFGAALARVAERMPAAAT